MRGEKKCGSIELGAYHSNFMILYLSHCYCAFWSARVHLL